MAKHQKLNSVGKHGKVSKHGGGVGATRYRHSAVKPWKQRITDFYLETTDKILHAFEKALGFVLDKFVIAKDRVQEFFGSDSRAEGRHSSPQSEKSTFDSAAEKIDILLDTAKTKLRALLPSKAEKFGEAPKSERFAISEKPAKRVRPETGEERSAYIPKRAAFMGDDELFSETPVQPMVEQIQEPEQESLKKKQDFSFTLKAPSVPIKDFFKIKGEKKPKKKKFYPDELPSVSQLEAELKWERKRKYKNVMLRNSVFALVAVAAAAVLVATLFLPVLQIYGSSMTPTLSEGNIVLSLKGSDFEQGDIISFYYNNKILVKRVIAFEGDWVNIDDDGTVYVNNKPIDEPYLKKKAFGECDIKLPYQVPSGRIFVCGDHRETSVDSRSTTLGCVSEEQIVGKIVFRVWPVSKLGSIS